MTTKDGQRTTLFINPSIVKQARAQALVEGISLTDIVQNALIKYLPNETIIRKVAVVGIDD
ncbi:MAG: hypothetical protein WC243_02680 [Patescibacteria group bacterium]|jgi:hypothetical protein